MVSGADGFDADPFQDGWIRANAKKNKGIHFMKLPNLMLKNNIITKTI